ncbi:MAG: hypothetical protein LC733_02310, partial [Actinobacteria bacterium]|nr:hypothetical protein [Actinomycetota bacterium]
GTLRWAAEAEIPVASGPLAPGPAPDRHRIGVINSHDPGECRPTKAQIVAAEKLIADTKAGTARYAASMYAASADGYVGPSTPATTDHYSNGAYSGDGRVLDPTRPESLMYTLTSRGPVLVGVMYLMNVPGEFGPEVGGCLTRWHVHTNVCLSTATFQPVQEMVEGQACPVGTFHFIPPPALHVWLIDVPGGRFAPDLDEDYLIRTVGP